MFLRFIFLKCDDCDQTAILPSGKKAQDTGWHFEKDGKCYCTKCAPFHRDIKVPSPKKGDAVLTFGFGI